MPTQPHNRPHDRSAAPLRPLWQQLRGPVPAPVSVHCGARPASVCAGSFGLPRDYGMGGAADARVPPVLPPAQEDREAEGASPSSDGCDGAPDHCAGAGTAAGLADAGADVRCVAEAWEQLLEKLRSGAGPAVEPAADAEALVGPKPADRVLRAQGNGEGDAEAQGVINGVFMRHMWVINTMDWIDVEHVLRKMLRCESSECFAFHTTGYAFFRSCATMHLAAPSDYLRGGEAYRFPGTEVTVEILRAHPEGVLEVGCYFEYVPV